MKTVIFLNILLSIFLLLANNFCFAQTVVINKQQVIDKPTKFKNVTLDLTHGGFTIKKNGSLDIENSTIDITISPSNPFFVRILLGSLTLKNNIFNVTVSGISADPDHQALFNLIIIDKALVEITGNNFTIDTPFTVGFLTTNQNLSNNGFSISQNTIKNFHGGIYLYNTDNAEINDNNFLNVSFANALNNGCDSNNYRRNIFSFPGNLKDGDAIDVVDSSGLFISDNVIASSANYGVLIMGGQDITIVNNKISDGLSFGIYIQTPSSYEIRKNKCLSQLLAKRKMNFNFNNNIVIIHNYIEQNRFGLAAGFVNILTVRNNFFIQKFSDSAQRKFWTNNDILLSSAFNVDWVDNLYKEAFTQEVPGDNSLAIKFVEFPAHGGVILP